MSCSRWRRCPGARASSFTSDRAFDRLHRRRHLVSLGHDRSSPSSQIRRSAFTSVPAAGSTHILLARRARDSTENARGTAAELSIRTVREPVRFPPVTSRRFPMPAALTMCSSKPATRSTRPTSTACSLAGRLRRRGRRIRYLVENAVLRLARPPRRPLASPAWPGGPPCWPTTSHSASAPSVSTNWHPA
jgi:hypothetical protein